MIRIFFPLLLLFFVSCNQHDTKQANYNEIKYDIYKTFGNSEIATFKDSSTEIIIIKLSKDVYTFTYSSLGTNYTMNEIDITPNQFARALTNFSSKILEKYPSDSLTVLLNHLFKNYPHFTAEIGNNFIMNF